MRRCDLVEEEEYDDDGGGGGGGDVDDTVMGGWSLLSTLFDVMVKTRLPVGDCDRWNEGKLKLNNLDAFGTESYCNGSLPTVQGIDRASLQASQLSLKGSIR